MRITYLSNYLEQGRSFLIIPGKKKISFAFLLAIFFSLSFSTHRAAVKTAISSGAWSTVGTWSPSGIPQCGDTVLIPAAFVVTVSTMADYGNCGQILTLRIFGELHFQTGKKLILPCNSTVTVYSGGTITGDNGGGSSSYIEICNQIVWSAQDGTVNGPAFFTGYQPLPVSFLFFDVKANGKTVTAVWETAQEPAVDSFLLEKSTNGIDFIPLYRVVSHGSPDNGYSYEFTDENVASGTSYYRLIEISAQGSQIYHETKIVEIAEAGYDVYPNPSSGMVHVRCEHKTKGSLNILSSSGEKIRSVEFSEDQTLLLCLPPGYYMIQTPDRKNFKLIVY